MLHSTGKHAVHLADFGVGLLGSLVSLPHNLILSYREFHDGFVEVHFSDPLRGLHGATPPEILHMYHMGVEEGRPQVMEFYYLVGLPLKLKDLDVDVTNEKAIQDITERAVEHLENRPTMSHLK
jgi:hypothetical protein